MNQTKQNKISSLENYLKYFCLIVQEQTHSKIQKDLCWIVHVVQVQSSYNIFLIMKTSENVNRTIVKWVIWHPLKLKKMNNIYKHKKQKISLHFTAQMIILLG